MVLMVFPYMKKRKNIQHLNTNERVTRKARDMTATHVYVGSTPITLSIMDYYNRIMQGELVW